MPRCPLCHSISSGYYDDGSYICENCGKRFYPEKRNFLITPIRFYDPLSSPIDVILAESANSAKSIYCKTYSKSRYIDLRCKNCKEFKYITQ